jgi:hypothetical protein
MNANLISYLLTCQPLLIEAFGRLLTFLARVCVLCIHGHILTQRSPASVKTRTRLAEPVWVREERRGAQRAKEPEKENARPKRLLAEKELAIDILNELAKGKF